MVTTGNGRQKVVVQDIIDRISLILEASARQDFEAVHQMEDELKDLVLNGIMTGDFQGLTAKVAARLALSPQRIAPGARYTA